MPAALSGFLPANIESFVIHYTGSVGICKWDIHGLFVFMFKQHVTIIIIFGCMHKNGRPQRVCHFISRIKYAVSFSANSIYPLGLGWVPSALISGCH